MQPGDGSLIEYHRAKKQSDKIMAYGTRNVHSFASYHPLLLTCGFIMLSPFPPPFLPSVSGLVRHMNPVVLSSSSFLRFRMASSSSPHPPQVYDLIGLGFGPANVALSGALLECDVR